MSNKWIKLPDQSNYKVFKCKKCGCTYLTEGSPPLHCHHCRNKGKAHG